MPPEDRTIAALRLASEPPWLTVQRFMAEARICDRLARRIIYALVAAQLLAEMPSTNLTKRKVWRRS